MWSLHVSDATGSIELALYDGVGEQLAPGDCIRVQQGCLFPATPSPPLRIPLTPCISTRYASLFKNRLYLYKGEAGTVVKIGE